MYLSRVEIDTDNRRKVRGLTHLGAYHNWVEGAFPEELSRGHRSRKLWRIDSLKERQYLLVLSEERPDAQRLERYAVEGSFECKIYDGFLDSIRAGEKMRFRIALNPVHAVAVEGEKRGKVLPLWAEQDQRNYLLERAARNGFEINKEEMIIVERGTQWIRKQGKKPVAVVRAVYEGLLTVQDVGLFRELLTRGMGREKAYGFGFMTVIPVR